MTQCVQADDVTCLEHGGFGSAHGGAEKGIHLGNRETVLEHDLHGLYHSLDADPVSHEIGCVFGHNDPFAEDPFPEVGHKFNDLGKGLFSCDNLQKMHVPYRIKEMRPQKMLFKVEAEPLGHGF